MREEALLYDLAGKVALITGASGKHGIGRAIALRLAECGAEVAVSDIVANRTESSEWRGLPDVVREIEDLGRRALAVTADVADAKQVDAMVAEVLQQFGHIDVLVNNAGALAGRDRVPVVELKEEVWDHIQRVNVKGTFLCSRAIARAMIERGHGGKIINMSSIVGKKARPRFAAYSASKFAIRGFTQALALELAPFKINVNAICPALIDTERVDDMAAALAPQGTSPQDHRQDLVADFMSVTPLGRLGQPQDVAHTAAFLASSEADYLTGLSINVAGGALLN